MGDVVASADDKSSVAVPPPVAVPEVATTPPSSVLARDRTDVLDSAVERVKKRLSRDIVIPASPIMRNNTYEGNLNDLAAAATAAGEIKLKRGDTPDSHAAIYTESHLVAAVAACISLWVGLGWDPAHWLVILTCLVTLVMCALGMSTVQQVCAELYAQPRAGGWAAVPLTDKVIDLTTLNKFANSCQVRKHVLNPRKKV